MGSEWKPIETAPKDGRVFLAANDAGAVFPVYLVVEPPSSSVERGWFGRRKIIDNKGGTYVRGAIPARHGYHGGLILRADYGWQPTHWMPLPEPPLPEFDGTEGDFYGHPIPGDDQ